VFLTLGEAAKQTGFSKATLSRAVKDGKLSAQKSAETQSYKIDPAELFRWAEAMQVVRNRAETEGEKQSGTPSSDSEKADETAFETRLQEVRDKAELEARARLAEERLSDLKQQLEEMKRQRDKWQEQAERLAIAPPPAVTVSMPQPESRGWWPWRRSA
jgi:excisionase family DNA binding protein